MSEYTNLQDIVHDCYDLAIEADSRLDSESVRLVPYNHPGVSLAKVSVGWNKDRPFDPTYYIQNRMGSIDEVSEYFEQQRTEDPTTHDLMAQRVCLEPDEFTPLVKYAFSALHELGHVSQYFDTGGNTLVISRTISEQKNSLPLPDCLPSAIASESGPVREQVEANWHDISISLGVRSIAELVKLQARAYRDLTSETNADHFAAEVLEDNPDFVAMLRT